LIISLRLRDSAVKKISPSINHPNLRLPAYGKKIFFIKKTGNNHDDRCRQLFGVWNYR
jgi:hypothetical protein